MIISNDPSCWGNQTTDEAAQRAAEALCEVLTLAAELLGIDEEIEVGRDSAHADDGNGEGDSPLDQISDSVWSCDAIQAAAYESTPVDAAAILRQYNAGCRRCGGTGHPEFD